VYADQRLGAAQNSNPAPKRKSGFGRLIRPAYKRVCRAVGYALTGLDEPAM
jgi:hypothetical protein